MKLVYTVAFWMVFSFVAGCNSQSSQPDGTAKPFLDEKKQAAPHLEWNREVTSRKGGTIGYRVSSQGPFGVTVVTDKGYQAMVKGVNPKAFKKSDVLFTIDVKEAAYEGKVTLPPGSSYFIIENQSDKNVELHLQCYESN